jgi:hypothetical protein
MFLLDVNVWIALAFATHVHHPAANVWFDSVSGGLFFFCRTTQQGIPVGRSQGWNHETRAKRCPSRGAGGRHLAIVLGQLYDRSRVGCR